MSMKTIKNSKCEIQNCRKNATEQVVTVTDFGMARVYRLCESHYATNTLCNQAKHVGDTHSLECIYVKKGE